MLLLCRVRLGCDKGLEHRARGVTTHLVLEKPQVHNSGSKFLPSWKDSRLCLLWVAISPTEEQETVEHLLYFNLVAVSEVAA